MLSDVLSDAFYHVFDMPLFDFLAMSRVVSYLSEKFDAFLIGRTVNPCLCKADIHVVQFF